MITKTKSNIDLNCDMGEIHPITGMNYDREIMPFISSCNICCGYHSGSLELSEKTIKIAHEHNVSIGAHPSYNDKVNFGRLTPIVEIAILKKEITDQILSVKRLVEIIGNKLNHIKPHGALYNDLAKNEALAETFVKIVKSIDPGIKIYGLANSMFQQVCLSHDMFFVSEVFADRVYDSKNELRSRQKDNAVIYKKNTILKQIDSLTSGAIIDFEGNLHKVEADTICLHSDTTGAVSLAKDINQHLKNKGIEILPIR